MEWQPIETAPRDGTKILIWSTPGGGYFIVIPHVEYDEPREDFTERWTWKESAGMYGIRATHWMPLPDPPNKPLANSGSQENDGLQDVEKPDLLGR